MVTAAFVNGNPETGAVWQPLLHELTARRARPGVPAFEPVVLEPPGFGGLPPSGWQAGVEDYQAWLIEELERLPGPVHLVGHDWGGILTLLVAIHRPDLLLSWVSDAAGAFDPDYVWHPAATVWQTDGEGERNVQQLLELTGAARAALLTEQGMTPAYAEIAAAAFDASTAASILTLYRSARQPYLADAGARLGQAAARPGLVVVADQDPTVGTLDQRERSARRAGAGTAHLTGVSHWWLLHAPAEGARLIDHFWSGLPSPA